MNIFQRVIRITVGYAPQIDHDGEVASLPHYELSFYLAREVVDLATIRKKVQEMAPWSDFSSPAHDFLDENGEWRPGVVIVSSVGTVLLENQDEDA